MLLPRLAEYYAVLRTLGRTYPVRPDRQRSKACNPLETPHLLEDGDRVAHQLVALEKAHNVLQVGILLRVSQVCNSASGFCMYL